MCQGLVGLPQAYKKMDGVLRVMGMIITMRSIIARTFINLGGG